MTKDDLKNFADNPDFIEGIYNYCDRWCERCPYTARCMNYAMSPEARGEEPNNDIRNAEFWNELAETMHATLELMREMAEEQGIDLDAPNPAVEEEKVRRTERRESARNHP